MNKKVILFLLVLAGGIFLRIVLFSTHPGGLNQDEASIGYDAWAIMNYGMDRNGYTLPVHMVSWGSGQNALYAYFSMPFIRLFDLNIFSVRCVNLIFGLFTIIAVFFIVKKFKSYNTALLAMTLVAFSPWHMMMSRWGLESNLLPAMIILGIWVLFESISKNILLIPAAFLFGLSLYAYGAAYVVITLFFLVMAIYIFIKKLFPLKICIAAAGVFAVVATPIYLFILTNLFKLGDITLFGLQIPQMNVPRMTEQIGFSFSEAIVNVASPLLGQFDGSEWNAIPASSLFYIYCLPFTVFGIVKAFHEKHIFNFILLAALFCSFPLVLIYNYANVNRMNVSYLPLLIFTAFGIAEVYQNKDKYNSILHTAFVYSFPAVLIYSFPVILVYLFPEMPVNTYENIRLMNTSGLHLPIFIVLGIIVLFSVRRISKIKRVIVVSIFPVLLLAFIIQYFGRNYEAIIRTEFFHSLDSAIYKAVEITDPYQNIYITTDINMPYIFVLFYLKIPPKTYLDTVQFEDLNVEFQQVKAFDRYIFDISGAKKNLPGVYLVSSKDFDELNLTADNVYSYRGYKVLTLN